MGEEAFHLRCPHGSRRRHTGLNPSAAAAAVVVVLPLEAAVVVQLPLAAAWSALAAQLQLVLDLQVVVAAVSMWTLTQVTSHTAPRSCSAQPSKLPATSALSHLQEPPLTPLQMVQLPRLSPAPPPPAQVQVQV